jgi:hypothetical protein
MKNLDWKRKKRKAAENCAQACRQLGQYVDFIICRQVNKQGKNSLTHDFKAKVMSKPKAWRRAFKWI